MTPDHETWNTCPVCGKKWQEIPTIPDILHRTWICSPACQRAADREAALEQPEDLDE